MLFWLKGGHLIPCCHRILNFSSMRIILKITFPPCWNEVSLRPRTIFILLTIISPLLILCTEVLRNHCIPIWLAFPSSVLGEEGQLQYVLVECSWWEAVSLEIAVQLPPRANCRDFRGRNCVMKIGAKRSVLKSVCILGQFLELFTALDCFHLSSLCVGQAQ